MVQLGLLPIFVGAMSGVSAELAPKVWRTSGHHLASLACLYNILGILQRRWPKESLPKGFRDNLSEAYVGSAEPGVDFLEKLDAFGCGDAF